MQSAPLSVIALTPSSWVKAVTANEPRRADAFDAEHRRPNAPTSLALPVGREDTDGEEEGYLVDGVVGKDFALAVHARMSPEKSSVSSSSPTPTGSSLSAYSDADYPTSDSRTFYLCASSRAERDEWCHALSQTIGYVRNHDALRRYREVSKFLGVDFASSGVTEEDILDALFNNAL